MTTTIKNIIPAKQAEATSTAQYTASGCRTIIDKFTATNTTASAVSITVNLVASGGSATTSNTVISSKGVASGETYTCPELTGHIIEPGGFIATTAGSAAALTIRASGREVT